MATEDKISKWELFKNKKNKLVLEGLESGKITTYDNDLIIDLRNIYQFGIPASIVLLSKLLTSGNCADMALLVSKLFLNKEEDINLLYTRVNSISLNPNIKDNHDWNHCVLEVINKDGKHYIYDTTAGLIFDKDIYFEIEDVSVIHCRSKEVIKEYLNLNESEESNRSVALELIAILEQTYNKEDEIYSKFLKREIDFYKKQIDYNKLVKKVEYLKV